MKIPLTQITILTCVLIFSSCASEDQTEPPPTIPTDIQATHQQQPKQAIRSNFTCTNNVKFNITFSKNKRFAYIVFDNAPSKAVLKDTEIASGIEYGNGKLFYKEYKGRTSLEHLVNGKMRTDTCHKF